MSKVLVEIKTLGILLTDKNEGYHGSKQAIIDAEGVDETLTEIYERLARASDARKKFAAFDRAADHRALSEQDYKDFFHKLAEDDGFTQQVIDEAFARPLEQI